MDRLKTFRRVCAGIGAIMLLGLCSKLPFLFKASSHGEISTIKLLCILMGAICLMAGVLRFALSNKGRGASFVLAVLAFLYAFLSISPLLRWAWPGLALFASALGMIVDFWPASQATTES